MDNSLLIKYSFLLVMLKHGNLLLSKKTMINWDQTDNHF